MTSVVQTPAWLDKKPPPARDTRPLGICQRSQRPRTPHPVSWVERCGIEEEVGNPELFKFMDNNIIGPPPLDQNTCLDSVPFLRGLRSTPTWWATCSSPPCRFVSWAGLVPSPWLPPCTSSCSPGPLPWSQHLVACWVASRMDHPRGNCQRLKSLSSMVLVTSR
jgi:hypothetical protein